MNKTDSTKPGRLAKKRTEDEDTISGDQFFNDIMAGFEEARQAVRGEKELRTTYVSAPDDEAYSSFYDEKKDELYIQVSREKIATTESSASGIAIDYDMHGKLVGMRLSQASRRFIAFPPRLRAEKPAA